MSNDRNKYLTWTEDPYVECHGTVYRSSVSADDGPAHMYVCEYVWPYGPWTMRAFRGLKLIRVEGADSAEDAKQQAEKLFARTRPESWV